jgi:tetratricopeptide (TPR) repeat protein
MAATQGMTRLRHESPGAVLPWRPSLFALGWLVVSLGCATGSATGPSPARSGAEAPTTVELDVLVAEMAARDGDFDTSRAAMERAAEKDPESGYLQYRLSRIAAQTEDIEAAVEHAERGFALDPDDAEGRIFLGRLYRLQRDVEGVERVLRDEQGDAISVPASQLLYQVYLERGRLEDALVIAEALRVAEPDNLAAYMALATVYERMSRFDEAEETLRAALEYHPNRFVLYSRLARMRRARNDRDGEIALYREVLAEYPDHYGTLVSLGEAQIAQSKIDDAIDTYSEIARLFPDDLQVIRRLASLEFGAGYYEAAATRLTDALSRYPAHSEFSYSLGQVLRGLARNDDALAAFEQTPKTHALYVESRMQIAVILESEERLAEALVEIEALRVLRPDRGLDFHAASLRARIGDFEGGVAILEGMLAESPKDSEILYQLGVLHGLDKQVDEALGYMQAVLERDPNNAQALNYIGYTYAERGQNLEEAERMIEAALKLSPEDGYIADSLGWVYYMRARNVLAGSDSGEATALLELALKQLDLAVELTGGDPVVSEHLGDVYLLLEQRDRALHYYEEAVQLEPREDEQPDLQDKLERLRTEMGAAPAQSEANDSQ